mmetsp:Transcript_52499/g.139314  ORF Transcript_52499/g.139314 Transcript_52499/m.139314 type:complete len:215 (-) Transcript_52499:1476-2120(-)
MGRRVTLQGAPCRGRKAGCRRWHRSVFPRTTACLPGPPRARRAGPPSARGGRAGPRWARFGRRRTNLARLALALPRALCRSLSLSLSSLLLSLSGLAHFQSTVARMATPPRRPCDAGALGPARSPGGAPSSSVVPPQPEEAGRAAGRAASTQCPHPRPRTERPLPRASLAAPGRLLTCWPAARPGPAPGCCAGGGTGPGAGGSPPLGTAVDRIG